MFNNQLDPLEIVSPFIAFKICPIIDDEMVLEEVLQEITKTKYYFVYVKDNKNKIIGKITLKQLLSGIQRPRQENKKYA